MVGVLLAFALTFGPLSAACNTAELKQAQAQGTTDPTEGPLDGDEEPGTSSALDGGDVEGGRGAARPAASHAVTVQIQPSDSGAAVLAAIQGAKSSVHMTMYLLSNDDVIDALIALKQAGKDVKVVLNQSFPPNGGDNTPAFDALKAKGVAVKWAPSAYTFTHAKTIVIDASKVLIMTMNLTYSSAKTNREYIATDTDPDDVADVEALFQADFANQAVKVASKLVVSPSSANSVEPREHLKQLIDSARTSLDVEVQTLSDVTVVDAIVRAHQAGVAVRVVISGQANETPAQAEAMAKLEESGVQVRSLKSPDPHAKVIVVDEEVAFVGSQNMTSTALTQNREVGVITDAAGEVAKIRQVIAEDFAKATPR